MILQALSGYYKRMAEEGGIAPRGFKRVEIPFLIILNQQGKFIGLRDTRDRSGNRLVARSFLVPEEQGRSGSKAWQTANLLWDHYGYVLKWPKSDSEEHRKMAEKQHGSFLSNVKSLHEKFPEDEEIAAVFSFLSAGDFTHVRKHPSWQDCAGISGCNISFMIEGKTRLVCQNDNVRSFITSSEPEATAAEEEGDASSEIEAVCLVSGEKRPIARLHPRTPIAGAKSSAKLVSFQKNMGFDSYGKLQSYNAPTAKSVAFAYTTALNHMLARDSRQKLFVGDATAVFWAERKNPLENLFAELFGEPAKENPDQLNAAVRALFASPETGTPPLDEDYTPFFVLGLAPNAARIAVRFWYPGTVAEVAKHIKQHFMDCAIIHGPKQPEYLSLFRLLISTATQGESKNIPPNMAGDVMKAILTGAFYSQTLLASALRRCQAEQDVTYPRAAIIKGVLSRDTRLNRRYSIKEGKEVGMSLDPSNTNPGYLLGRLFAVLERIQAESSGGWGRINSTIRDRFYGAASSTPGAVFPHLMKLKNYHLSKLLNYKGFYEGLVGEIVDKLDADKAFPNHLNLPDQGRFAVGYYHQRYHKN